MLSSPTADVCVEDRVVGGKSQDEISLVLGCITSLVIHETQD